MYGSRIDNYTRSIMTCAVLLDHKSVTDRELVLRGASMYFITPILGYGLG